MNSQKTKKAGSSPSLLDTLKERFLKNAHRHSSLDWAKVEARLQSAPDKLSSLQQMEDTGGEPDVVGREKDGSFVFVDCSPQSPEGRASLCYDAEALESRKKFKPKSSATALAAEMGVELLTEEQYQELQRLDEFDTKSSSWLKTPPEIRKLGGAIFGDRRFGRVFIYHNGAESYYSGRGFRARLVV
ncbi:DUF4256 domain-containing protein [Opitutaceae bacterium EW11]|nr:DUF4256 domain-containing protein [Opitutaceae bacterium EW11]